MGSEIFSREGYLNENYRYFHLRDTAGQERDFHFHDFDKIVVLLSGAVSYALEGVTYELRAWDILLVKHHTVHKALIDKTLPYDRVIIYIDRRYFDRVMPEAQLTECFDAADKTREHLRAATDEQRALLSDIFGGYERAARSADYGAQAMRDTIMMQLLIYINRIFLSTPGQNRPAASYDPKIESTLSYINENLSRELSVDALAERVYLSKYHFMRLFKAQTGNTVHSYIRQKRLLYAARLIREGVPANKAAEDCGFSDYSAFHRAFTGTLGISPGALKK